MWVCLRLKSVENIFSDGQCDEPSFLGVLRSLRMIENGRIRCLVASPHKDLSKNRSSSRGRNSSKKLFKTGTRSKELEK